MGLDMYLTGGRYFNRYDRPRKRGELESEQYHLGYWRKHPNLHGYIVQTFADGKDECQIICLEPDDIRTVIAAVKAANLPDTTGFFFGSSDTSPECIAKDIAIF